MRELWRAEDVEWLDRGIFLELDDDEDELEVVVHPSPRPLGPADEHAQLLDGQRRLVASAVALPAGTEALVTNRLAEVAPGAIDRKALERFARRGRVPSDWFTLDEPTVAFCAR